MEVSADDGSWIPLDGRLRLGIQQTLRVPDDGGTYPLPPALGRLPVHAAAAYPSLRAPDASDAEDFIVVLHAQEAVWLQFNGVATDRRAVKIGVGQVDALTGLPWNLDLHGSPQNYIVCPYQPWLDGFKTGDGVVRQFVATRLHGGATVEHQLTGLDTGGIVLACFRPNAPIRDDGDESARRSGSDRELGVGAGGQIHQRIYPDPFGRDVWMPTPVRVVRIRLIDAVEFTARTGEPSRPSAIDAATYTRFGLPWFEVFDSARGDVPVPNGLSTIKSVDTVMRPRDEDDARHDDESPAVKPTNVRPISPRSRRPR